MTDAAREELEQILNLRFRNLLDAKDAGYLLLHDHLLRNNLMEWHLRHPPTPPTREQIIAILHDQLKPYPAHGNGFVLACQNETTLIDALLALFTPTRRAWCPHIRRHPKFDFWQGAATGEPSDDNREGFAVRDTMDICPVSGCHAPRPA